MTPDIVRTTFRIPEQNLEGLTAVLTKIARKAAKLNSGAITWYIDTEHCEVVKSTALNGLETVEKFFSVEVKGPQPKVHGWTFVATLEHALAGTIVRGVQGLVSEGELAAFRQTVPACDHCNKKRARIDTFILRSEHGEYKQIGRNCLRDFLGHEDPEAVAAMWECLWSAQEEAGRGANEGWGSRAEQPLSIECFLSFAAAVVRRIGYVSRAKAEERNLTTTATEVSMVLTDNQKHGVWKDAGYCTYIDSYGHGCWWNERGGHIGVTDQDIKKAEAALEWIREMSPEGLTDYMYNLWVACQDEAVPARRYGIVVSLLPSHQRELTKNEEKVKKVNEHPDANNWVGAVGTRQVFRGITVKRVQAIESHFGTTHLHTFVDAQGHTLKWFSSRGSYVEGQVLDIKATVKDHEEYKGWKVTTLTRVKEEA